MMKRADPICKLLADWQQEVMQIDQAAKQRLEAGFAELEVKLERLTDLYLAGELSREEYLPRKEKWLNERLRVKRSW